MKEEALYERGLWFLLKMYGGVRIRAYHPIVGYIPESFVTPQNLYLVDPRFVVTVVKSSHNDLGEYWPEMPWVFPSEVRLLAALSLAVPDECQSPTFVPAHSNRLLQIDPNEDISQPETLALIKSEAALECKELIKNSESYQLADWKFIQSDQLKLDRLAIFNAIDLSDQLLLRGLYCLLKGQHLMTNEMFGEEAFMNVQISREAALEIIRERLMKQGLANPSYNDAHAYLRERFQNGDGLVYFLEEQHERWVATRHPKSRHGTFWTPPLMLNDYFHTYGAIAKIYRYLLVESVDRNE